MKLHVSKWLEKLASSVVTMIVMCAAMNVSSTCMFMAYQPDVPEELLQ